MPQLVEPLLAQHASPEELYSSYSRNTLETAKAIKALTKFMQEPGPQDTLKRAKESRAANPEGITPWIVTEHPDWLEVRTQGAEDGLPMQEEELRDVEATAFPTAEEVLPAVERFRTKHPGIEINHRSGDSITVEVINEIDE